MRFASIQPPGAGTQALINSHALGTATGSFTTESQARLAQESLGTKLRGMPWLRGIGIVSGDDGYALKVNVQSDAARALVPKEVMGVMVFTDVVGDIRALSSAGYMQADGPPHQWVAAGTDWAGDHSAEELKEFIGTQDGLISQVARSYQAFAPSWPASQMRADWESDWKALLSRWQDAKIRADAALNGFLHGTFWMRNAPEGAYQAAREALRAGPEGSRTKGDFADLNARLSKIMSKQAAPVPPPQPKAPDDSLAWGIDALRRGVKRTGIPFVDSFPWEYVIPGIGAVLLGLLAYVTLPTILTSVVKAKLRSTQSGPAQLSTDVGHENL